MKTRCYLFVCLASLILNSVVVRAAKPAKTPTWTDPILAAKEHAGFKYMGEYINGDKALQVTPEQDKFYLAQYQGGLPGAGWDNQTVKYFRATEGELSNLLTGYKQVQREVVVGDYPAPIGATIIFNGKKSPALNGGNIVDG
ncbi:MAG: hypothetical protein ACSHW0_11300 [Thalassotalea sp.]